MSRVQATSTAVFRSFSAGALVAIRPADLWCV